MNQRIDTTVEQTDASRNGEQFPKGEGVTPDTTERRISITEQQAALLARVQASVIEADRHLQLVGAAILAGHGLGNAQLIRVEDGPVLVVRVAA